MKFKFLAVFIVALLAVGCASTSVTEDAITERTAVALGLNKGDFVISNRVDEGVTTRFLAKAKNGQEYNCYVTGTFSVTGRIVSDAICTKKGEVAKNPLLR
jgi:hypothetical protein